MLVYRLCKEEEIKEILDTRKFKNVGKSFKINASANTHKYIDKEKYLHFFNKKDDVLYFNTPSGYFICTYDIPYKLLDRFNGIGFYFDRVKFRTLEQVIEYAIPINYISFENLVKIEEIKDDIDYDDYLYNNMDNKLITIYEKEIKKDNKKGQLVLIRKKKNSHNTIS